MKILYVGESNCIHDFRLIRKYVENGYDTYVLTHDKNPLRIEGAKYFTFPQELNEGRNRFVNDIKYVKYIYEKRKYIRQIIKKIKPDILHAVWIPVHGFISALSGFHPFVLMPWGSDVLVIPQSSSYLTKKQIIWTIKKADMIQCDAHHVKNEIINLSSYPKNKIFVFPQGIELNKFNPDVNGNSIRKELDWTDKIVLIMTRAFKPIYGIEYLLKSLNELIKKNKDNVRLLLCGDGPLRSVFKKYVTDNKLKKYVHFAGFIDNNDLPKYLAAADIYISTSLSDGTSSSLLEAMAVGLPCIVTDLPSNLEWIIDGKNGYIVPKEDSQILSKKIIELIDGDNQRKKFGNNNIEIAFERANWKNFEKLEKMYKELTTRH